MARAWDTAVEQAADVLAEMLVELANGEAEHSHEDIAAGVLKTGLNTLLGETPASDRVEDVARVIYERIHDKENQTWSALPPRQKAFWLDIARAAIQASDGTLLRKIDV